MNPALAFHALLAGGHGKQPITKKQPAPPLPSLPGADPRMSALLSSLRSQQQPQSQIAPAPNGKPNFPKKPVVSRPTDSTARM